ncbi:MAG: deoxyribodipyrimidine photo-lyase, partial [Myxococcota bacterium]
MVLDLAEALGIREQRDAESAVVHLFGDHLESLPPHLRERVRVLNDGSLDGAGEFILVWLHHAVRGHENPAIDAALHLADALDQPVIAYQGLGGNHRFNSDRHHTFILEGARDAARELAERGVRHVMHLPSEPATRSPLRDLARRATAIITEDFPAPPFPAWTAALASATHRPFCVVDTACVVPMKLVDQPYERAFKFRNRTRKLYKQRIGRPWSEAPPNTHD